MEKDIVYILRNGIRTDEIIYSLRSVEKNFPHGKIWIYGGKPEGIEPDEYVYYEQEGENRYWKVRNTIEKICHNDNVSDQFWLFNDDFFILEPVDNIPLWADGTIEQRTERIRQKHNGRKSDYAQRLDKTAEHLREKELPTMCYAVHVPMLVDRKVALEVLEAFPDDPMFRCLYGNWVDDEPTIESDVKIVEKAPMPKGVQLLSTDDQVWRRRTRESMQELFPSPSRWEVRQGENNGESNRLREKRSRALHTVLGEEVWTEGEES